MSRAIAHGNLLILLSCTFLLAILGSGCSQDADSGGGSTTIARADGANRNGSKTAGNDTRVEPSAGHFSQVDRPGQEKTDRQRAPTKRGSLGDILPDQRDQFGQRIGSAPREADGVRFSAGRRRPLDEQAARSAGIRKVAGKHLTLYTDIPPGEEIDALPAMFDQAVPQWCAYFGIEEREAEQWQVNGFLMQEKQRFSRSGLLPAGLPPFLNGFARGRELWLYEQPTAYYRRHLLLHEGTHAFMYAALGSCGPPWYMEGTAELLATHALTEGKLKLKHFPQDRDEVPMLGRIKLVQDHLAAGKPPLPLGTILTYDNRAHLQNEAYAWCWALAAYLDAHPAYAERFRSLRAHVQQPDFNRRFLTHYKDELGQLTEQWQLFAARLTHGHDITRSAITYRDAVPLGSEPRQVTVRADRGWQDTGIELSAGQTCRITARGRYQIGREPKSWWCEPHGVTLRYHAGQPLGKLLAAVRSSDGTSGTSGLLRPIGIGSAGEITAERGGKLFLRINEPPNELADNAGQVEVQMAAQ